MNQFLEEVVYLYWRALKQTWRPLASLIPSIFIPIFFFAVNSAAFREVAKLPGFTTDSYLKFQLPVALFMSVFFSAGDAGIDLVMDISSGYFDKLLLAPIRHISLILGKLLAVGTRGVFQGAIVLLLAYIIGLPPVTGFWGVLLIFLLAAIFSMAWSAIGLSMALLTKNPRLVQSLFVLFFPALFMTTMQMPKELLSGWYKIAVTLNPVTYVLEGIRGLMIFGYQKEVLFHAFLAVILMFAVLVSITLVSFRKATA